MRLRRLSNDEFDPQHRPITGRKMRLRKQFAIQLFGNALNVVLFFALTPFLVNVLGVERYGVMLTVLGLVVYVGVAELGIGAAVSREIAGAARPEQQRLLGAALLLACGFGVLGGGALALLSWPEIGKRLLESDDVVAELEASGPALFLLGFATVLSSIPQGALLGLSKFLSVNVVTLVGTTGASLLPAIYAVTIGKDLSGLIGVIAVVKTGVTVLGIVLCCLDGVLPKVRPTPAMLRRLLSYGGWSTVAALAHRATNSIDRIVLAIISGASAVPAFVIPQGALSRSQIFSSALMSAAFPRLVKAPDDAELVRQCYRGHFLLAPAFVAGIGIMPAALSIWLGDAFAHSAYRVGAILALAIWVELLANVPYVVMQARAELRREAGIGAAIALPNLLLLVIAVSTLGAIGAACVFVLRAGAYLLLRMRGQRPAGTPLTELWLHTALVLLSCAAVAMGPLRSGMETAVFVGLLTCGSLLLNWVRPSAIVLELGQAVSRRFGVLKLKR